MMNHNHVLIHLDVDNVDVVVRILDFFFCNVIHIHNNVINLDINVNKYVDSSDKNCMDDIEYHEPVHSQMYFSEFSKIVVHNRPASVTVNEMNLLIRHTKMNKVIHNRTKTYTQYSV